MASAAHAAPEESVSLPAMVEAVLAHAASTGELKPSTLVEFRDVMSRFVRFTERGLAIRDVSAIGEAEVRAFIASRRADGAKASLPLMHNRRTVCRYLFRTARTLGVTTSDPTRELQLPVRQPVGTRPLTDEEVRRCRSHAVFHSTDLHHPVAWALVEATARTYEISQIRVSDVDAHSGLVRLPGSPRCDPRTAALTDWGLVQVRRRLEHARAEPADPLFPMRSSRVPRASASMAVIEVLRAAGIKAADVRPISVVAWRGAKAYAEGIPLEEVAALLGMRSLDRTAELIGLHGRGPA